MIKNILRVNEGQLKQFYVYIKEADALIIIAQGRSEGAIRIAFRRIKGKRVMTVEDVGFPGKNIKEAAPILEEEFNNIALVANSGSGETTFVKQVVEELAEYIEETGSKKFTINVVTSNPESTLAGCGKRFGSLIELKGRENNHSEDVSQEGIMNDTFELSSMVLLNNIKEAINKGKDYKAVFPKVKEESVILKKIVDIFVGSDVYQSMLEIVETRATVVLVGKGPAKDVAIMIAIRLSHVKKVIGSEVFSAGPFSTPVQPRDVLIAISWSGENRTILEWVERQKSGKGYVFSIVGNMSSLSRESQSFMIEAPEETFYEIACFVLSFLPLELLQRIHERGGKIPDEVLRWLTHSGFA